MKTAKKNNKTIDLFLDSGAYSAYTQGIQITLQEYITFIKQHMDLFTVYANLDTIGDPVKTLQNQKQMERAGLHPLPCFHYGEPFKYLKYYLDRYEYVALGGMVPIPTKALLPWLDHIFSEYVCDSVTGMPNNKIHGYGLTAHTLLIRYPWYSVDSTSWVIAGRMGSVLVPRVRSGEYDHNLRPWQITVSTRAPSRNVEGKHIETLTPKQREIITNYVLSKGFTLGESSFRTVPVNHTLRSNERWHGVAVNGERVVESFITVGLCNDYKQRDELNVMYFLDLEASRPEWPWPFRVQTVDARGLGLCEL